MNCAMCGEVRWYRNNRGVCVPCALDAGETVHIDGGPTLYPEGAKVSPND